MNNTPQATPQAMPQTTPQTMPQTTPQTRAADRYPATPAATPAATRWSSAARRTVGAAAVALCLLGAAACQGSKTSPDPEPATSSPATSSPGTGSPDPGQVQQQQQQQAPGGGSRPDLGTPFTPSGHSSASLPPLSGNGS
ncbi:MULTISPECIES: hypothetical protein [unclassified Frankia]|uniref:hypothetical protein n=1 Tax=unclassified Frankia TaxID=2632575 RepID=UPI000425086B|nr:MULTISPECIES: hypothetical protein [unclassified Frankia]